MNITFFFLLIPFFIASLAHVKKKKGAILKIFLNLKKFEQSLGNRDKIKKNNNNKQV